MEICIIGAGISGLSLGRFLSDKFSVTILEKSSEVGGIARAKMVDGVAYHTVGGHCLNSKNKNIMEYIFTNILPIENWHIVDRNAKISILDSYISYPIEYSIREIAQVNLELAYKILIDLLSTKSKKARNLADWFKVMFGKTLAELYFIPYNSKIWNFDLDKMSYSWVHGKLPIPSKVDIIKSLLVNQKDNMPHHFFYYPNSNTQNTFIDSLSNGLKIKRNYEVKNIEKVGQKWIVNGELKFDLVVSTIPLNILPKIIQNVPQKVITYANKLRYNVVTTVLWKSEEINHTWTYYPSKEIIFHRHIHIGNFFTPKLNYTITEAIGNHSFEKMIEEGKKIPYLIEPIDYNVSDHAYVVYDRNREKSVKILKEYLESVGLYTLGRFGEWEYYNMDVCMERALQLATFIQSKFYSSSEITFEKI